MTATFTDEPAEAQGEDAFDVQARWRGVAGVV